MGKSTTGRTIRRPGKAQPPPGTKSALCLLSSPGGAALTGPTRYEPGRGPCRPGKAQPPPGKMAAQQGCVYCRYGYWIAIFSLRQKASVACDFSVHCAPG
ncbi:hypothetical protein CWN69_30975 [Klebsiella quasipneumoniae]|nr:hypothetical protein CWN69_30975 [Klebsiella quasipneumoniae]